MTQTLKGSDRGAMSPKCLRLQADARYARERYQLYKARVYGPRATDPGRLAELDRACEQAERRFRAALAADPPASI